MSTPAHNMPHAKAPRHVVLRASRETVGLVVAAAAMTFAMSFAIHAKHDRLAAQATPAQAVQEAQAPQQDWAGGLAALAPEPATPGERLSSAALVVPKAALALPQPPAKPKVVRQCGDAACLAGKTPGTAVPKRQMAAAAEAKAESEAPKRGLLHQLNPLNHLPDVSMVGRPFTYAGGAVAGWFKRL